MTGFLTALSTLAGFVLLGWGVRQAVRQLVADYAAFSKAMEREPDYSGEVL